MLKPEEIIIRLSESGIHVFLDNGKLKSNALKNSISNELTSLIKKHKTQIIKHLEAENVASNQTQTAHKKIKPVSRANNKYPLSFSQQRLWFIQQMEPHNFTYNIPITLPIKRNLHISAAEKALQHIIDRHESLRTVYHDSEEGPFQSITNNVTFKLHQYDLSNTSQQEREVRIKEITKQEHRKFFDLSKDLMLRGLYIKLSSDTSEQQGLLVLTIHHIAADGWSLNIIAKEFATLYHSFSHNESNPLEPLTLQYIDYLFWQKKILNRNSLKHQLNYWDKQLTNVPVVHKIPLDYQRPEHKSHDGAILKQFVSESLAQRIYRFCNTNDLTVFMFIHAVFTLLLSRHSNSSDIVIATPVANRTSEEVELIVGFFVNTLLLRASTQLDSVTEYLNHIKNINLDAQANQDVPFESLVERYRIPRNTQHTPLFQIMLSMNSDKNSHRSSTTTSNDSLQAIKDSEAKFDLLLDVSINKRGGELSWTYDKTLFNLEKIETFNQHFNNLLEGLLVTTDDKLSNIKLLDRNESTHLIEELNQTYRPVNYELLLHQTFEQQAKLTPDSIAIDVYNRSNTSLQLTYKTLDRYANQLAKELVKRGVKENTLVALFTTKSPAMIIGILAILKAGGAYLPLEPDYPDSRIEYMLEDSGSNFILCNAELPQKIKLSNRFQIININDATDKTVNSTLSDNFASETVQTTSNRLAYVIYTSGTTGNPKGVMVDHINVLAYIECLMEQFNCLAVSQSSPWLWNMSFAFDASIKGLLSLFLGRRLIVTDSISNKDPYELATIINHYKIEVFNANPHFISPLIEQLIQQQLYFPQLITSGELIPNNVFSKIQTYCSKYKRLAINAYGPTETTINSSFSLIGQVQTIGRPTVNTQYYIVDKQLNLVPKGVTGELCIAGLGLSRGYINAPKLTQQKFIENPYRKELKQKMFITGDLVRYGSNNEIEYIGRIDEQVKIRGHRIELAEIEYQLKNISELDSYRVMTFLDSLDQNNLLIYFKAKNMREHSNTELVNRIKLKLERHLPDFMLPSAYIPIENWPLLSNGKLDLRSLPKPDGRVYQHKYTPAATEIEKSLVLIWSNLLKLNNEKISITDNFFDLGGHSLLVVRLVSEIKQEFNKEVSVKSIFELPTIQSLAPIISSSNSQSRPSISPVLRNKNSFKLSFAQERLWFIDKLGEGSSEYNLSFTIPLLNDFNPEIIQKSLETIIKRHESLRTNIKETNEGPVQIINHSHKIQLKTQDLSDIPKRQQREQINNYINSEQQRKFDLANDQLIRASLVQLSDQKNNSNAILLLTLHHIVTDGWSTKLFRNEFFTIYQALSSKKHIDLPPITIQYVDYSEWQRSWLKGDVLLSQLDYWKKQLDGIPAVHNIPLDYPRSQNNPSVAALVSSSINKNLIDHIWMLAKYYSITPFMLIHAALSLVISRHSNSSDIAIGTPVANRTESDLESLIGFFVNSLVLRVDTEQTDLANYLSHVKQVNLDAQNNQDAPFDVIVEHCKTPRTIEHTPLFQIMLNMEVEKTTTGELNLYPNELENHKPYSDTQHHFKKLNVLAKFDLTINIQLQPEGGKIECEYDSSLFAQSHIESISRHLKTLLKAFSYQEYKPLNEFEMLSEDETTFLTQELNHKQHCLNNTKTVTELFESICVQQPDAIALLEGNRHITYKQLDNQANLLASIFLHEHQMKSGDFIGVCLTRSVDYIVSVMAILKIGACYVPLDPNYPKSRLSFMLDDSNINKVICRNKQAAQFNDFKLAIIQLDKLALSAPNKAHSKEKLNPLIKEIAARDLAYVIYTSGSTGKPKGVMISHENILSLVTDSSYVPINNNDIIAHASNVSFDASTFEIWSSLCNGAKISIINENNLMNADRLEHHLYSNQITMMFFTTALFNYLTNEKHQCFKHLNYLLFGGEQANNLAIKKILELKLVKKLVHVYGPTEATTFSTYSELTQDNFYRYNKIPIGRPLANRALYILDRHKNLTPFGSVGELYIGGKCVATGYLNRPELTESAFIKSPFRSNEILYKTGDLVQYLPDSNIAFVGRIDQQVKIRGYRIEPAEIEKTILTLNNIQHCVVLANKDKEGQLDLVAYLSLKESVTSNSKFTHKIRQDLKNILPNYMQPSLFMIVEQWPLNKNGKIDISGLPKPTIEQHPDEYITPSSKTEIELVSIWSKLLNLEVDKISINANFFELGGHSLLAVRLVAKIRDIFEQEISVKLIFDSPTVKQIAELIEQNRADKDKSFHTRPRIKPNNSQQTLLPLSFAQERLWFIDRMGEGSTEYNMPAVVPIKGEFDIEVAKKVFTTIIKRHEPLRTNFRDSDTGPIQLVRKHINFQLECYDLTHLNLKKSRIQVTDILSKERSYQFDLSKDLMIKVAFIKLPANEEISFPKTNYHGANGLLLVTLHHIASDGWSMNILEQEFSALYRAYSNKEENPLQPLKIAYSDYAFNQRKLFEQGAFDEQIDYWQKQLAAIPPAHSLPLDSPRPKIKTFAGAAIVETIPTNLCQRLIQIAQQFQITPFMLLHAIIGILIARHSHSNDIVIGTPVANRLQVELESMIGFFVNTIVLRTQTDFEKFEDYLHHIKAVNLDAQANQDIPFEKLVDLCKIPRSTEITPLFQIMLSMNTNKSPASSRQELKSAQFIDGQVAKFDLSIDVEISESSGSISWVYDKSIFTQQHVSLFNNHLKRLLNSVAEAPDAPLNQLKMLSDSERYYLTHELNNTPRLQHKDLTIAQLIEKQALMNPDAIAIVFQPSAANCHYLSYYHLNKIANQLAQHLYNNGVDSNSLVAVYVQRNIDMLISLVAVLKLGAGYVPLDTNFPKARLEWMLNDCQAKFLLTQSSLINNLDLPQSIQTLTFDYILDHSSLKLLSDQSPMSSENDLSALAYVIYTSGSTGQPKGVMVEHQTISHHIQAVVNYYSLSNKDNVLQFASLSFDTFIEQTFATLITGATLHLRGDDIWPTQEFFHYTLTHQVTLTDLSPNYLAELLEDPRGIDYWQQTPLQQLVVGGEELQGSLVEQWHSLNRNHCRLFNAYGPTEAIITSSVAEITSAKTTSIGQAFNGKKLFILDKQKQLTPYGCVGELYIGGNRLARGYLNNDSLSREKFIDSPFDANERLYQTGDLVRYLDNGEIDFIGRVDDQVKIRGFRVEISEIEYQLSQCNLVAACIVTVQTDQAQRQQLVAYFLPNNRQNGQSSPDHEKLKQFLNKRLPNFMVPSIFVCVSKWPLLPNGKIDRSNLPKIDYAQNQNQSHIAPRNKIEKVLCKIWQEIFAIEKIGINDNFFELGGNSLLTIKLATKINQELAVKLSIYQLFQHQTVADIASIINKSDNKQYQSLITMREGQGETPIIMIPGLGGSSHVYYELTKLINCKQAIYGLDARGIHGNHSPHESIEAIAEYNLACILEAGISESLILIGHSLGAAVAFEMAKNLEIKTQKPIKLILLDASPYLKGVTDFKYNKYANISHLDRGLVSIAEKQMQMSYRAGKGVVEQILLIKAQQNKRNIHAEWQPNSRLEIIQHSVPGDHFSMLKAPFVESLANVINHSI